MRAEFRRTVRTTGIALILTLSAGLVLGTAPASAASSTTYSIKLRHTGSSFPDSTAAQNETRGAAAQRCFEIYGYQAREVKPYSMWGKERSDGKFDWYQSWKCISQ